MSDLYSNMLLQYGTPTMIFTLITSRKFEESSRELFLINSTSQETHTIYALNNWTWSRWEIGAYSLTNFFFTKLSTPIYTTRFAPTFYWHNSSTNIEFYSVKSRLQRQYNTFFRHLDMWTLSIGQIKTRIMNCLPAECWN